MKFRKITRLIFNKLFLQKLIAYICLILVFFLFKDFLLIFFLTFIFAYLFLTFWSFIKIRLDCFLDKILRSDKTKNFFKNFLSLNILVMFLYLTFIWVLFFAISDLLPQLTKELKDLPNYVPVLAEPINLIASKLEEFKNLNSQIGWSISEIISKQDIDLAMQIFDRVKSAWVILIQIILSLILSYIFIMDREKLHTYLNGIKKSNFWFFYDEYKIIIEKIVKTFWLVFQAQSIIALTNAILTTFWLFIIWLLHHTTFPFIYTLAIIVFICWFIPVIWTFISSVPILIIWFSMVWWIWVVIEIIILITVIHAIEAYYLNPKIVSSFIHLPVSLTFLVLIISEHFIWFAWLVIWISSFYLVLELLKDADKIITKSKIALKEMDDIENDTKWEIKKWIRVSRRVDDDME